EGATTLLNICHCEAPKLLAASTSGVAFLRHPFQLRTQTYLFFAVDSLDRIGKNFSAWRACDRLEGRMALLGSGVKGCVSPVRVSPISQPLAVNSIQLN